MTAAWRRRARGQLSVVLACAVAPFLATSSVPATTVALEQPPSGDTSAFDDAFEVPLEDDLRSFTVVPASLAAEHAARARTLRDAAQGAVSPRGRLWS